MVKFTSGEDVERVTIGLKSIIAVETFNNEWKEQLIYSFFLKGGIINEIPNVLIYAPIKNRFSKLEIKFFQKIQTTCTMYVTLLCT